MPETRYDLAIIGGGCAGLSLAYRLVGSGLRVAILEPRKSYEADRTWSFWRTRPDPFEGCVIKRWSRWRVSGPRGEIVRSSDTLRYETVSAERFYDTCLNRIRGYAEMDLHLDTGVTEVIEEGTYRIETDRGPLLAHQVVDTRPVGGRPAYGQFFAGIEIRTSKAIFDDSSVDLMAFSPPRSDRIDFGYVLPFSPDHGLVEATVFGASPPEPADLDSALADLLSRHIGNAPHEVLRQERGMIPMDADHVARKAGSRMISMGLRGGASRPSTGYAFVRIQQMADVVASALRNGQPLSPVHLDGPVTRRMDALFLKVLRSHPDRGPELFSKLFAQSPPDRLEHFLSGSTAWKDRLSVALSLPPGLFLRTLAIR